MSKSNWEMYQGVETATDMTVNANAQRDAHVAKTGKVLKVGMSQSRYAGAAWRTWTSLTSAERIGYIDTAAAKDS